MSYTHKSRERAWEFARAAERKQHALRGVVTRTKNRVGHGVCPCCQRSFAALREHMKSKHPDYAKMPE